MFVNGEAVVRTAGLFNSINARIDGIVANRRHCETCPRRGPGPRD